MPLRLDVEMNRSSGFTMVELMVTIAVAALLMALAIPAMSDFLERNRVRGAAENLISEIQYARTEAVKRNAAVFVAFDTNDWCMGIADSTGCDCTVTDPNGAGACKLDVGATKVLKTLDGSAYSGITMSSATFAGSEIAFDPVRGTANVGTVTLLSPNNYQMQVVVTALGRASLCSPAGTGNIRGYPEC